MLSFSSSREDFVPLGAGDWFCLAVCSGAEVLQKGHSSGAKKLSGARPLSTAPSTPFSLTLGAERDETLRGGKKSV